MRLFLATILATTLTPGFASSAAAQVRIVMPAPPPVAEGTPKPERSLGDVALARYRWSRVAPYYTSSGPSWPGWSWGWGWRSWGWGYGWPNWGWRGWYGWRWGGWGGPGWGWPGWGCGFGYRGWGFRGSFWRPTVLFGTTTTFR